MPSPSYESQVFSAKPKSSIGVWVYLFSQEAPERQYLKTVSWFKISDQACV